MKQIYSPVEGLAGLVLAAGESSRLGRAKSLLIHQGRPLIRHVVDATHAVCGAGVTVVTGAEQAAIEAALDQALPEQATVACVHNPDWQLGMGASLAAGVRHVLARQPTVRAIMLTLCDQPRVGHAQLAALAQLWQNAPAIPAVAGYAHTVGAPAVFPRDWFDRLMLLQGDQGARVLLRDCDTLQRLEMPEAAADIDTPDDLYLLDASTPTGNG